MATYDLAVTGGTVVLPNVGAIRADIGTRNGKISAITDSISSSEASEIVDARGKVVFPGAVDPHFHIGIYRPIGEDTASETMSSLVGGVTSVLSYFRTGQHYLNKAGSYKDIFPEVLQASAGNAYTDYGYHIGIMSSDQISEVDWLVGEAGVASFKYFMFYKGLNLSASSTAGLSYTMSDVYDLGHLYRYMQAIVAANEKYGHRISLSLHCEHAEIIRTMIDEVKALGLTGLEAYSKARPPWQERLAIAEATVLADVTKCPINLLHLSSAEALKGGKKGRLDYPDLDIRIETTLHHLCLTYETGGGIERGKVNPPLRTQSDIDALWDGVLKGDISWIGSDHACCMFEQKSHGLWESDNGFGGTSLVYPVLVSEGYHKRGLPLERVAELVSAHPAKAYGLFPRKGTIAVGTDADLAVIDMDLEQAVTTDMLLSHQDHTPFEGYVLKGWPTHTIRGGQLMYENGKVVGQPTGVYLKRPDGLHAKTRQPVGAGA